MIKERIIKLKSQPRWVAKVMLGVGGILGLGIALHMLPIGGSRADEIGTTSSYIHYETVDGVNTISICDSNDSSSCITMMDRNLGAIKAGTGCSETDTGACGNHYQWGNNYGFPINGLIVTGDQKIDCSGFGPSQFSSEIFFTSPDYHNISTYCQSANGNLWGGMNDVFNLYPTNSYPVNNGNERQGPCPNGYHVPSQGEWYALMNMRAGSDVNGGLYTTDQISQFMNDFKIPLAGYRDYILGEPNWYEGGLAAFLWSSSPDSRYDDAWNLQIWPSAREINASYSESNNFGYSVRCFKDSYLSFPSSIIEVNLLFIDGEDEIRGGEVNSGFVISASGSLIEILSGVTKTGYELLGWYESGASEPFDLDTVITEDMELYARWDVNKDIIIQVTATEANQTLKINKYFANAYTVDRGDGMTGDLTADTTHTYNAAGVYTIILSLSGANRWTFRAQNYPYKSLVPVNGTDTTGVKIIYMPSLAEGFGNSITNPGNYFFQAFNYNGALISLPEGSFDTSNITTVGDYFFSDFNYNGSLISLPEGSFDTSNISGSVGHRFFSSFNHSGILISLPVGSFDTSKIIAVGNYFFEGFNSYGQLTSLPVKSFDISNITTVGNSFFYLFNEKGSLTSLPEGSFDISNITIVGDYFFYVFNAGGGLTSLPDGSFDTSNIITVGDEFFASFNAGGGLTSLPDGSFDTSNITTVGDEFFASFNAGGGLTSLPEGSFNTSNIIRILGDYLFVSFNNGGRLTNLPDSFKLSSVAYNRNNSYPNAFNSPNYTLNRKVSDLVSGLTAPKYDKNTFSDNQPGRCGVHPNWLVNKTNACSITYNPNGGNTSVTTMRYDSDITSVVVGDGVTTPTRTGYVFGGWYTKAEGGEKVNSINFPDMDGNTVYAQWEEIPHYTVTYNANGGTTIPSAITVENNTSIVLPNVSRDGYVFLGWYTELAGGEFVGGYNSGYTVIGDITLYAKWEKIKTSGGTQLKKDNCPGGDHSNSYYDGDCGVNPKDKVTEEKQHNSADEVVYDTLVFNPQYSDEMNKAYQYSYHYGITTKAPISKAEIDGNLTRVAMAKMLSQYAINVLGMEPDKTRDNKFNDVSNKLDGEYDDGVTLAYQLGIMGINMPNNEFRPYDLVPRAEFVTALSRLLYKTPDGIFEETPRYYVPHMEKLIYEGIINDPDPKMLELRGYVMLMLMRGDK